MSQYTYYMDLAIRFAKAKEKEYIACFLEEQKRVMEKCMSGEGYVLSSYYIPNELFVLFDLPVLYCERIAGFGAACNMIPDSSWKGLENYNTRCSYQLYLEEMIRSGIIPLPQLIIASDFPCRSAYDFCKWLSEKYQIPFLSVFIERNEDAKEYHAAQLNKVYEYLVAHFEQKHSMKEVLQASNAVLGIKDEIDQLRFQFPGIIDSQDIINLFTICNDFGKKTTVQIMELLLEDIDKRVTRYSWDARWKKLMWLGTTPLRMNLMSKIENEYCVKFVYEDLFQFSTKGIHEQDVFQDMADRLSDIIYFTEEKRIHEAVTAAKRFEVDGCVHYSQRICKFLPPIFPKLQKEFENSQIPILELRGDGIDKLNWDDECEQVDTFIKSIRGANHYGY